MRLKLPIIGEVTTGKDVAVNEIIREVPAVEKSTTDLLGGLLDFTPNRLSSEQTISTKILKANTGWVYRNNDAIAQEVSKMEFELFTIGLTDGEVAFNKIDNHPLLDLLDKPNQETTKTDAIYIIQSHKKLTGDAFWVKLRNGRQVVALRSLPPDKVKLDLQSPTPKDPTVIRAYIYEDRINGQEVKVSYDPKDVIHFKKPNPNNSFRGYGSVEALADTIDLDNLTIEITKKFFQNGAITNFVLTTEAKLQDDQLKRLNAQLRSMHGGVAKAYRTLILGGGLEPKDISYSNKDQEFIKQLEWYRDKIMIGFGNTKASLGMIDDVNRASHESSQLEWKRNTVVPDMTAICNTLNEFLVPEFGENLILGYSDPVPEDRSNDIREAAVLYNSQIIKRNEARDVVGYEEIGADGDEFKETSDRFVGVDDVAQD